MKHTSSSRPRTQVPARSAPSEPGLPARIVIGFIRAYQLILSPWIGRQCRFYPTCSVYAVEAVTGHGALRGLWLAIRRLGRCHPFRPGGFDPVPGSGSKS